MLLVPAEVKENNSSTKSLYWAKVWPAAIGLSYYLHDNVHFIKHKKVMELAAGLGLPSFFSAAYAAQVCVSDIEPMAVNLLKKTIQQNDMQHITCQVIDWNRLEINDMPDTLLLSDVNYEPAQFNKLNSVLHYFLDNNVTIILSTPQRLMAKAFINDILPWVVEQETVLVNQQQIETPISIFVLKKQ